MATNKQISANRANAQKSTGPKTEAGRQVASRNAVTHGLFAKDVVAAGEDPEIYEALLEALKEEHQPETVMEALIIERLALAFWREKRLARAEKLMMDSSKQVVDAPAFDLGFGDTFEPPSARVENALADAGMLSIREQLLVGRYQTMINNQIRQTLKDLREERSLREKTIDAAPYVQIAKDTDNEPLA